MVMFLQGAYLLNKYCAIIGMILYLVSSRPLFFLSNATF